VALSERFDPVRRMSLGLDSVHGYLVAANQITPPPSTHEGAEPSYVFFKNDRGEESVLSHLYFLGFEMFTDLEIRKWQPSAEMPEDFATMFAF
jgi:hypothetical protein